MNLQMVLVYVVVGVALFYLIKRIRKTTKGDSSTCDKCELPEKKA